VAEKLCEDGMNYTVEIEFFSAGNLVGKSPSEILRVCFGEGTTSRDNKIVQLEELLDRVVAALNYAGEVGNFPSKVYLASQEHTEAVKTIRAELRRLMGNAKRITSLIIDDGHPFYPVFWDFSYIIELSDQVFVLVGSASD